MAGVRQEDSLSPTLFNFTLHEVVSKKLNIKGNQMHSYNQICA